MTEMTQQEKIEALATLALEQARERLAQEYSQQRADAETVEVVPGSAYTRIDRGRGSHVSGFLMVEHETGVVYGTRGYGKVRKGHCYGTLDTTGDWYWGAHYPQPASEART